MEHESDGDTNCNWCTWNNPQWIGKGNRRLGNKRKIGDHPVFLRSARILRRVLET